MPDESTLPAFNERARCAKCGCPNVSTSYHKGGCTFRECPFPERTSEHLGRYCRRCHFRWAEAVLGEVPLEPAAHVLLDDTVGRLASLLGVAVAGMPPADACDLVIAGVEAYVAAAKREEKRDA